jgi:plastocyanin
MPQQNQTLTVNKGDTVTFWWLSVLPHDVVLMQDKIKYENCDFSDSTPLIDTSFSDSYVYNASEKGTFYFSCSFPKGIIPFLLPVHCYWQQKLTLTVS